MACVPRSIHPTVTTTATLSTAARLLPITDPRMTRFWITLQQGVNFVLTSMELMRGGEIFVPKIPSMSVLDLASSLAPGLPHRVIGIRPGEKLHEIMVPEEMAHHTVEFDDHFVIAPAIKFFNRSNDFSSNALQEQGKLVAPGFEYVSDTNPDFLTVEQMRQFNQEAMS